MNGPWIALGLVLVGCGGSLSSPVEDGGSGNDSSPGQDGSPGQDSSPGQDASTPPACPISPPANGSGCPLGGVTCEYGTNPDPACNQQFACVNGTWTDQSSGTVCPPQSDCPATYASIPAGQDCSPDTIACAYPQGECICTHDFGGPYRQTPGWDCFPAQTGCPEPRPDIGTPCTPDPAMQACNYGACSGGLALTCTDGRWQPVSWLCPG